MCTAEVRQRCLQDFCSEREVHFIWKDETLVIFFVQFCFFLRQDLENTIDWAANDGAVGVYVRARSTTLYLLPVTSERRKLAIFSLLKSQAFPLVERQ